MVSWLVEEITHLVVFNPYPYELNKCLHTYYSCTLPIVYMFLTSLPIDVCARFWKENGPDNTTCICKSDKNARKQHILEAVPYFPQKRSGLRLLVKKDFTKILKDKGEG